MKKLTLISFIILGLAISISCNERITKPDIVPDNDRDSTEQTEGTWTINGWAQKGPFSEQCTVEAHFLDDNLERTGAVMQTSITDSYGYFEFPEKSQTRYVELIVTGTYFNEVAGETSSEEIILHTVEDLESGDTTNINILTELSSSRIISLVSQGKDFPSARKQAENEVLSVFHLNNLEEDIPHFSKMLIHEENIASSILMAASVTAQAGRDETELAKLLNRISSELENSGNISGETSDIIAEGLSGLCLDSTIDNLSQYFLQNSMNDAHIPDFTGFLDMNWDGTPDMFQESIILSDKEINVSDEGGTFIIEVMPNVDFDVYPEGDAETWIEIKEENSTENPASSVSFTVSGNTEHYQRFGKIAVRDRNSSNIEYVEVSQKQKDALTVTSDIMEVGSDGGTVKIEVKANTDVQVEIEDDCSTWIRESHDTEGPETTVLQFEVDANPDQVTREGHIIFKSSQLSETVTIYQTGGKVLILGDTEYIVSDEGAFIDIFLTSSCSDFETLMTETVDWAVLKEQGKQFGRYHVVYEIMPNMTYDSREAGIIIKDAGSDLEDMAIIHQVQHDAIILAKDQYHFDSDGGAIEMEVQHNVQIDITIPEYCNDWISQIETKALETSLLEFQIASNPQEESRSGIIVIENIEKGISDTVHIFQGEKILLYVSENEVEIEQQGGTFELDVTSNADFMVEISSDCASWLKELERTDKQNITTLKFEAEANPEPEPREGHIIIRCNELFETVTVCQSGEKTLTLDTDEYIISDEGETVKLVVTSNCRDLEILMTETVDWIVQTEHTKLSEQHSFKFEVQPNGTYDSREVGIIIKDADSDLQDTALIHQVQHDAIILSKDEYSFDCNGGTINLEVQHNVQIDVTIPEYCKDWISQIETKALETSVLEFAISENPYDKNRSGIIILENDERLLRDTILVYQQAKYTLHISQDSIEVGPTENTFKIEVTSNVDYEVNIVQDGDWLYEIVEGDTLTNIHKFHVDENGQYTDRTATIIFSSEQHDIKAILSVTQTASQFISHIDIPQTEFNISYPDTLLNIPVNSNVPYTVSVLNNLYWLTVQDSGSPSDSCEITASNISVHVQKNESLNRRSGKIVIEYQQSGYRQEVTITQDGNAEEHYIDLVYNVITTESSTYLFNQRLESPLNTTTTGIMKITGIEYDGEFVETNRFPLSHKFDRLGSIPVRVYYEGVLINANFSSTYSDDVRLESITIPATMENFMCENGDQLKSITFLGDEHVSLWLEGCTNLEAFYGASVILDNSVYTYDNVIISATSKGPSQYTIPEGITGIDNNAFSNCANLQHISLPNTLQWIGYNAFTGTDIVSLTLPENVNSVGEGAFNSCSSLRDVKVLSDNIEFGNSSFSNCSSLETITLSDNQKTIPANFAAGCTSLRSFKFPAKLITVERNAFEGCSNLSEVTFNACLETIGDYTFRRTAINMISVPRSVKEIGQGAFNNIANLSEIVFESGISLSKIPQDMLGYSAIREITIPASVETIEYHAFRGCSQLVRVAFEEGSRLKSLGDGYQYSNGYYGVFGECSALTEVNLPTGLETIGIGAFANTSIPNIIIPGTVKEIKEAAFYQCDELLSITLPSGLRSVGSAAFYECSSLENISIGETTDSIAYDAFQNCFNIKQISSQSPYYEISDDSRCLVDRHGTLFLFVRNGVPSDYIIPEKNAVIYR